MIAIRLLLTFVFLLGGWSVYQRWSALGTFVRSPNLDGVLQAIDRDPTGPEYHFMAALLYRDQVDYLDRTKARRHLTRALELNPYSWRYWLEMGRTVELENPEEAEEAYLRALELNPNAATYHWRMANFYIRREAFQDSVPHLLTAVSLNPTYQPAALSLMWRIGLGAEKIESLWPTDRRSRFRFLSFLTTQAKQTPSQELDRMIDREWNRFLEEPEGIRVNESDSYFKYLFERGSFRKLKERWIELMSLNGIDCSSYQEYENLVWNGDFERPQTEGLLAWKLTPGQGYEVTVEDNRGYQDTRGLVLSFNGTENLNFAAVFQRVILEPGQDYQYSFFARSEELSTEQGLYLEIVDGATQRSIQRSSQVLGTTDWNLYSGTFASSLETEYVTIRLRRRPSRRIDNQLQGTVYVDSISITTSLGAGR